MNWGNRMPLLINIDMDQITNLKLRAKLMEKIESGQELDAINGGYLTAQALQIYAEQEGIDDIQAAATFRQEKKLIVHVRGKDGQVVYLHVAPYPL